MVGKVPYVQYVVGKIKKTTIYFNHGRLSTLGFCVGGRV